MREILFRAKTTDTNEWAIGYYDGYGLSPSISINPDDVFCNVDSETLGQFTGRYDKDGVRIFEGDILQFSRSISLEGENLTLELPHQLFLVKWIKGISVQKMKCLWVSILLFGERVKSSAISTTTRNY